MKQGQQQPRNGEHLLPEPAHEEKRRKEDELWGETIPRKNWVRGKGLLKCYLCPNQKKRKGMRWEETKKKEITSSGVPWRKGGNRWQGRSYRKKSDIQKKGLKEEKKKANGGKPQANTLDRRSKKGAVSDAWEYGSILPKKKTTLSGGKGKKKELRGKECKKDRTNKDGFGHQRVLPALGTHKEEHRKKKRLQPKATPKHKSQKTVGGLKDYKGRWPGGRRRGAMNSSKRRAEPAKTSPKKRGSQEDKRAS